jgi:hypothetical protein
MRALASIAPVVVSIVLSAGCDRGPSPADLTHQAADVADRDKAAQEQQESERKRLLAEMHLREELNKDFEQLLGHWDFVAGTGSDGQARPPCHLEIAPDYVARFRFVVKSVESTDECKFRLDGDDRRRFILPESGAGKLKVTRLGYRIERDRLTIEGDATDVLLNKVELSGEWRRTDWTQRSEAEIAHVLKTIQANLDYDSNKPTRPIVKVSFAFQAPVHDVHLRPLAGLQHLQDLDLSSATEITDAGLKHLAPLTRLKQLNLTNTQVSREAVQELQNRLPGCTITH